MARSGPTVIEESKPSVPAQAVAAPGAVTARAVCLALLLLPINAYWIIQMEAVRDTAHPTTISLFFNCVFILVVLTGLNGLVARIHPGLALRQGELLLIYAMLNIGSCLAGADLGQWLVASLIYPYSHATPTNGYAALFWDQLPRWAMVDAVASNHGFYTGHESLYTPAHLRAWLRPCLVWTGFMTVLLFVMQCVNVIIRQQWTDNERLTYPLVRLPLEVTDAQPGGRGRSTLPLTHNRLFWIGFALAAGVDALNTLNFYFPAVPSILAAPYGQSALDLRPLYLTDKPWSAINWLPATCYPFVIGLGMLMPLDFLFSSWFFYLTWKLQMVVVAVNAWDADPKMPYANYQALGAYLLFFANTLWLGRRYFGQVWRRARGLPSEVDDAAEPLSYRASLIGVGVGLAALTAFSAFLGLSWWLALAFFCLYLALALAITRMRAELGTPVHDLHFTGPDWTLTDLLGPRAIGAHGLSVLSLFYWFNRAYRSHPMPFQLEAFKMAEQTGARGEMRRWFWALLLAGTFGMVCAFWAVLHCAYLYGYEGLFQYRPGREAWDRLAGWLVQPQPANGAVWRAAAAGFLFAAFLQAMRVRFSWWPLHPLAYAVSGSWEMNLLWMPLLIAWVVKSLLLRYGGLKRYQASLPFFYGLILGQFIPGSLLNIWGTVTGTSTYRFWN